MLSDHYFGDVEAIDEGNNHREYFDRTFMLPSSFSLSSLNKSNKFIIVGRKGTGKTAVQFHLGKSLRRDGFLSHFFSFYNDLKPKDYNEASATQKIDMLGILNSQNIFLNYDFREVWERTFFVKLAEMLVAAGFDSRFTKFALGKRSKLSGIFEGLLRSATIKVTAEHSGIASEVGFDLSSFSNGDVPLAQYCGILRDLFARYHQEHSAYLFVDELVFSKLDAKDDEVRVRAAMVRDIFRTARELNNYFVKYDLNFHIIACVRPEIRDLINDLDAEIGKIFDGKSVQLSWDMGVEEDSLLFRLMKQKVMYSKRAVSPISFDQFVCPTISFGSRQHSLEEFLRLNTWSRPRDIVQLLNSIAFKSPNSEVIGEREIKNALNEYGRRSFYEIMDEISVRHGPTIGGTLRNSVKKQRFGSYDEFNSSVLSKFVTVDRTQLLNDLFQYGVIGNWIRSEGRYYWAHKGEEFFDDTMGVTIHEGLWNYFNIR